MSLETIIVESVNQIEEFYDYQTVIKLIKENSKDSSALKFGETHLSYKELEDKSDELAQKLLNYGIKKEEKIIVMFPLSFDLIVSIYAILKAGGTYVPINVDDGKERLKFIIEDLDCRFILGNFKSLMKIDGLTKAKLVEVNERKLIGETEVLKFPHVKATDLAYIIYTSGTTGRPKGVMVEHRNLHTFVTSMRSAITVTESDRWLQNPNLTFDMSVGTMFLSLCNGATLVLRTGDLHELLEEEEITHYNCTPGATTLVDPSRLPKLKEFAVGGEKVPDELIERFSPHCKVYDTYGPAEATINVSWTSLNGLSTSHIGTTLPGVKFYVVKDGNLAETRESGELWVAGDFVTRGYLNRPELTSEKFIKNPFGEGRVYKTGDKVRWLAPGEMEYQGRIDRQVKVRGHRLELDEIEKVINQFSGIKTTLAKVINDNLVAYVACEKIEINELVPFLKDLLPLHAVPAKIIPLKSFPLNKSGKIDEFSLPDPFETTKKHGVAPKTDKEKKVAAIWESILSFKNISLEDNFFDMGGNSLHVLKMINKIRTLYSNPKISNEMIFSNPVLKDFIIGLDNWVPEKLEEVEKVKLTSILSILPTTIYFSMGFIFPFVAFSLLSIKFPLLWGYAILEFLILGLLTGPVALPLLRKITFNPVFHKIGFKKVEIIEDVPLGVVKGNIFTLHPHGINDIHFFPLATHLHKKSIKFKATFEKITFCLPFNRTLYSIAGYLPAVLKSYKRCKEKGENLIVTPGEMTEMLLAHKPATIVLKSNLNFFQVAIKAGMPLIPCMTYNLNKSYKFHPELREFSKKLPISPSSFPLLPFRGRWGLPLPFRRDYKLVIGKKVEVVQNDNPSWKEIVELRDRYQEELLRIFNKYRPDGYPSLEII